MQRWRPCWLPSLGKGGHGDWRQCWWFEPSMLSKIWTRIVSKALILEIWDDDSNYSGMLWSLLEAKNKQWVDQETHADSIGNISSGAESVGLSWCVEIRFEPNTTLDIHPKNQHGGYIGYPPVAQHVHRKIRVSQNRQRLLLFSNKPINHSTCKICHGSFL